MALPGTLEGASPVHTSLSDQGDLCWTSDLQNREQLSKLLQQQEEPHTVLKNGEEGPLPRAPALCLCCSPAAMLRSALHFQRCEAHRVHPVPSATSFHVLALPQLGGSWATVPVGACGGPAAQPGHEPASLLGPGAGVGGRRLFPPHEQANLPTQTTEWAAPCILGWRYTSHPGAESPWGPLTSAAAHVWPFT